MPIRTSKALLVFLSPLVAACDCPTGPSRIDFSAQSALVRLTLSRGDTTLVSARGSGEFHATSPVGVPHRLSFRVEFPADTPVSHGVYVDVTEDVSLHSERLGGQGRFSPLRDRPRRIGSRLRALVRQRQEARQALDPRHRRGVRG